MENIDFEAPITNFRRLVKKDHSEQFRIYVKYSTNNNSENEFFIDTTINKARIISRKIDEAYQIDPTICQYQIKIPNFFLTENVQQSELQEIIQFILSSTNQKVHIQKEKRKLFTIFQYLLGEYDKEALTQLNLLINNQQEAIGFLDSEFHELSVQYLSSHLIQLIESDQASSLSEQIFNEIIDLYTESLSDENNEHKDKEITDIFDKMKRANLNRKILMHFLIHVDFELFNDGMVQYFDDNLDDKILLEALPRVSVIFKNQAKLMHGKMKKKGKITECQFNGNENSGIIAFLNNLCGGNALDSGFVAIRDGLGSEKSYFKNMLSPDPNSGCYNQNAQNADRAWIEFDFGQRKIKLSSYTICTCTTNDSGPNSWQISGSDDRSNWTALSNKANVMETKGTNVQKRFECDTSENYYQYIRFTLVCSWKSNPYYIHFKYIELFGSILEPETST